MRKAWVKILFTVMAIGLLGTSCMNPPATAAAGTKYDATQDARIVSIEGIILGPNGLQALMGALNTKVAGLGDSSGLTSRVSSLESRMSTEEGKASGITQASVDALSARIKTLEDWKAGLGTVTPTGGTSDTGTVTFTNNPVSIPQIFSSTSGSNSNPWIMTITNHSTTWQYVKPIITLSIASGQSQAMVKDIVVVASGSNSCNLTGELLNGVLTPPASNFSFSPATMASTATPSLVAFPVSGCNNSLGEIYIGPGQSQMLNIQIQSLKTDVVTLWNVSTSISSRSM